MKTDLEKPEIIQWKPAQVAVSALKAFEKNPRKIAPKELDALKRSIAEDGYHQRILCTHDLRVIGGHQRIKALTELGYENIEVLVADRDMPDEQFKRILVRDNLEYGTWEIDSLGELMGAAELIEIGFNADLLPKDKTAGLTDEDDTPAPDPARLVSKPGDIWTLGDHRLMCGSSTDADAVALLLAGARPMLMVTDPPYGVEYDASWREKHDDFERHSKGKVLNDTRADWREAWELFTGDVAYVWSAGLRSKEVIDSLLACGFNLRAQIIWVKQHFQFSRGDYHWQHEPCWYAVRQKGKGHWSGDRKQTTVWEIANKNPMGGKKDDADTTHGTQKPVECMRRPMINNSKEGDVVYEPFSGSGTTIIAAESIGRKCYAMELSPEYVDMAVRRWQAFTGRMAFHAETGKTFDEQEALTTTESKE